MGKNKNHSEHGADPCCLILVQIQSIVLCRAVIDFIIFGALSVPMISSPHMLREESNAYNVCIMGCRFPIPLFLTLGLQLREPVAKSSPLGPTACTLASQLHLPPPSHVFTLPSFRSEAELKTRHSSFKIELPGPTDGVFSHMLLPYGAVHLQCWIAFGALYTEKKSYK